MANVLYPPQPLETATGFKIFLAGSIDMGNCIDWQQQFIDTFENQQDITFLNPRRLNWDSSWEQTIENKEFNEQVNWELSGLEQAELIVMYFDPNSKAPISLLEMGIFHNSPRLIVCCPTGYWRKGNVDIVCNRYGITLFERIEDLYSEVTKRFSMK